MKNVNLISGILFKMIGAGKKGNCVHFGNVMESARKVLGVMIFIAALTACGGGTHNMPLENTPESVAVNFIEAYYRLDAKTVESLTYSDYYSTMYEGVMGMKSRVDPEESIKEIQEKNKNIQIRVLNNQQNENGSRRVTLEVENFVSLRAFEHQEKVTIDVTVYNEEGNWKVFNFNVMHG